MDFKCPECGKSHRSEKRYWECLFPIQTEIDFFIITKMAGERELNFKENKQYEQLRKRKSKLETWWNKGRFGI